MKSRGRPKGSKNKFPKGSRKRNAMHSFLRELPKEEQENAVNLSELTGISLTKICGDAMAEGLATLKADTYAELIRFNDRRGKVIHEKDLENTQRSRENIRDAFFRDEYEQAKKDTSTINPTESHSDANVLDGGHSCLGTGHSHVKGDQGSEERSDDAYERPGLGSEIVKMSGGAEEESRGIEEDDL